MDYMVMPHLPVFSSRSTVDNSPVGMFNSGLAFVQKFPFVSQLSKLTAPNTTKHVKFTILAFAILGTSF